MTAANAIYMPLDRAYLCEDCRNIGNDPHGCPACASQALLSLAGVLDREDQPKIGGNDEGFILDDSPRHFAWSGAACCADGTGLIQNLIA